MSSPNVFENKLNDKLKLSHERIKNKTGIDLLQPKSKAVNTNPYDEGSIDYDQWNTAKKDWNKTRGLIYGTSANGLNKTDAYYYDKNADGGFFGSDGDFVRGTLGTFDNKQRDKVLGDRKKVLKYFVDNGIYTPEDLDKHEIKDDVIRWNLEKNKDITDTGMLDNVFQYLKGMKDYGFEEPDLAVAKQNKPKSNLPSDIDKEEIQKSAYGNTPVEPTTKKPLLAPLVKDPVSVLPKPDPIETHYKKKRQGTPTPLPKLLTLNEPNDIATPVKTQSGASIYDTEPLINQLSKQDNSLIADNKRKKEEKELLDNAKGMPTAKQLKREDEFKENTQSLDSLVNANIAVDYNKDKNTFTYGLKDKDMSYDDVIEQTRSMATDLIDRHIKGYAKENDITGDKLDLLRAGARAEAGLSTKGVLTAEKAQDDYTSYSEMLFGDTASQLPQSVKDVAIVLNDKIEQLRILKSKEALGQKGELAIPEWLDGEGAVLSLARGLSPTILNNPVQSLGLEDFDIATGIKNLDNPFGPMAMPTIALLSDPRKIFSKEYTDSEAMHALIGLYQKKYEFSPDEAKAEIEKGFKDIDKAQDSWGHATQNIVNNLAELTGEIIGPFKLGAKGFDKVLEKGAYVRKFVEKAPMGKYVNIPAFKNRMLNLQRGLEGNKNIGGGVLPYYDDVMGFAPTNIARVTAASYASQMFYHGADIDEALASAENMAVLETFNQSFALAGMRGYKYLNSITKALRRSKGTQYVDDLLLNYQKKINTIHVLSSFPAQGLSTALMNPEATSKEFFGEMVMNLFMGGNNLIAHRSFNRQLKDYKLTRETLENRSKNWSDESSNRETIKVTTKDFMANQDKFKDAVHVGPEQKIYNEKDNTVESTHEILLEKKEGFYDYAKKTVGKDNLQVKDFKEVVSKNVPEDIRDFTDKMLDKVGDINIKMVEDESTGSPAYYDKKTRTIVFNNSVLDGSTDKVLTRAVMHEAAHGLTHSAYDNDKVFKQEVDDITKELLDSEEFIKLRDELEVSDIEADTKAYYDLTYAMQSPEEMIALMYDPGMQEGRDAIDRLVFKREGEDKPKSFKDRMWDALQRWFGKKEDTSNDYIKRFREIIEGYDYDNAPKQEKANTEQEKVGLDQPVFFMPELVSKQNINELNNKRAELELPPTSIDELTAEYRAKFGRSPNGIGMDIYMKRKMRELSNQPKEDNMSNIVEAINKSKDYKEEGFIDKSEIKYANEIFNVNNMAEVYEKSQGKSIVELTDLIKDKISIRNPDANPDQMIKIAASEANRISQKKVVTPLELVVSDNGYTTVAPIHSEYYDGTKPVDKTLGIPHYLNNFATTFPKSFRNADGELRSYVPERVDKFFQYFDPANITKIGGIDYNGKKSTKVTEAISNEYMATNLIGQGYYMIPRGDRSEVMWSIPGLGALSRGKPERAIDFGKAIQQFSFFRWLDSDSQWIGSKEGVFTGRRLADLGGKLDLDKLINKYVDNHNIAHKDLFNEAVKGEINTDDIDMIGRKLKQYYSDAEGQSFRPEYLEIQNKEELGKRDINNLLLNSITDLMTWGLDSGGASRTLDIKDNVLNVKKSPWKYHSILATSDPLFISSDYAKPFIPDAVKEDGSWDKAILKEKGIIEMSDGNLGIKAVFPNEMMFAKDPMLSSYFAEAGQDGASHVVNENTYQVIADMMLKDKNSTAIIKPKWQTTDENGNMFIYKTAMYDYGKDSFNDTHSSELKSYLNTVKDAVSVLSFDTSSKGSNTFRTRQENLLSTDNPNARALFDATGNIVDVIVKKDGEYKLDKDLFEKEIAYMQDQWSKGIVDPRSIVTIPITGEKSMAFIESSHPVSSTNAGAFGINQTPMAHPLFDIWQEDGGKGWKAIENFEDNIIARSGEKIKGAYSLRGMLEGINEVIRSKGNPEKLMKYGFADSETLKQSGDVITDVINELEKKIDKGNEDDEFMLPGMTNEEAIGMLRGVLNGNGEVIPQKLYNLYLAGNLFVSGMKNAKAGEKTMLQYQIRDYFSDAMLTRGYGANTYLMPDMESKAAIARMWEPMIEDLIDKGETQKADMLADEYLELMKENIDEHGKLKPFSKAVIVGNDIMEKLNIKPGDKAFLKLTPTDDLHSIVPVVVAGVSNKPGVTTFNSDYLTQVMGRDFDKDNMQIIAQNEEFLSTKDFNALYDLYDNAGMKEGRYKANADEIRQREKESINGTYKALGERFEYEDPTATPQSPAIYSKVQNMHGNVGSMITNRNVITNAIRNIDWAKDKDGYTALVEGIGLRLDIDNNNGTTGLSDRVNAIVQKMVDKYDHMPFNPDKAIYDEVIDTYQGRPYAFLDNKTKAEARREVKKMFLEIGGYGINNIQKADNLKDIEEGISKANISGKSVASKVGKMMTGLKVPVTNKPEVNKYVFNNRIGQSLEKLTIKMEQDYSKKLPPEIHSNLFNAYQGSKLNVGQHLQKLFSVYTNSFLSKKNVAQNEKTLNKDVFYYVSSSDFGAFTQGHKWKDIAAGTALYDYFNNNSHKNISMVNNKVFRGGYEYEYDGYNGWIKQGENRVKLSNIFAENGDLRVDWLDGNVLSSEWLRDLVKRKTIVSDNAKAQLIGKTIGNVSKYLESKIDGIDAGEMFTMLAYNSTGNVNQVVRKGDWKTDYNKSIYNWIYGKPKYNQYNAKKMKAVDSETSKEMRYDPLFLMQGAKSVGVNPKVNGKDMLTHMQDLAQQRGEKAFGPIAGYSTGDKLGMPNLGFKMGSKGLDINSAPKFIKSIKDLLGEAETNKLINGDALTNITKDEYKKVFDSVLEPELKKLINQKGKSLGWKNETIEMVTKQYINNFGPKGMDAVIENIKKTNTGDTKDFKLSTAYVAELSLLAKSLKKHFRDKEGNRLTFLRMQGNRAPIPMLIDTSKPEYKKNYSRDHIIAESFEVRNGRVELVKNDETGEDIKKARHYKVSDLVDEKLNISVGNGTLPKAYVEYIEPRNYVELIAQSGEANIKDFIDTEHLEKDVKGVNNKLISTALEAIKDDEILSSLINSTEADTFFNGLTKGKDSQIYYNGKALNTDGELTEISNRIIDDLVDKEIAIHSEQMQEEIANGNMTEADIVIDRKALRSKAVKDYQKSIETMLRLKTLAQETSNTLLAQAETIDAQMESRAIDLSGIQAQEVYVQTQRLRDLAERLNDKDIRNVLKEFRDLDYKDVKTLEIIDKVFYEKSKKRMSEYGEFYKETSDKWIEKSDMGKNKYIITKEMFPELYKDLPGSDNFPLFPYMAQRFLKDSTIKNIETNEYSPEVEAKYKRETKNILRKLDPSLTEQQLTDKAVDMFKDLVSVNEKRYNINHNLYALGHKLGLEGFDISPANADPETVFKKGYQLRKELTRQYENQLKRLNDSYEISMIDGEQKDQYFEIEGIEIDLVDFLIAAEPELAYDNTLLSYSVNNFKEKVKNTQISAISALENVYKTLYTKSHPNEGKVAEAIVLSELGKVSGDKAIYNQHYDGKTIKEANIEAGTDSYVRYTDKLGKPRTIYGKVLGSRDLTFEKVADENGKKRIETKKFLFVMGEKKNGGKLHVINTDVIHDAVTGEVYGGRYSQPVMYNNKVRKVYSKHTNDLLDELSSSLSQKSQFAKEGRKETDAFIKNVDQRMRSNDLNRALEKFEDVIELTESKLDKSLATRLKTSQDFINNMNISDTYMGLGYLGALGAGAVTTVGGLATVNPALIAIGTGLMGAGGAGYSKRIIRVIFSNLIGNASWAVRNTREKTLFLGHTKELFNSALRSLKLNNKIVSDKNSDALARVELAQLEAGADNRAKDMFTMTEETIYKNENISKKSLGDVNRERKQAKKYGKEFEKINNQIREYKKNSQYMNGGMDDFFKEMVEKYTSKDMKLEFKNDIPFINGKAMTHYQAKELSLMNYINYILSLKGKFIDFEIESNAGAQRNVKAIMDNYSYEFEKRSKEFAPDELMFRHNLNSMLAKKSIGDYRKSSPQRRTMNVLAERFSRFAHLQKLDQTFYLKERHELTKSIMDEFKKDKEYQAFKSYLKDAGGLPLNDYKIESPKKELAFNFGMALLSQSAKLAGLSAVAYNIDEIEDWFGMSVVAHDIMKVGISVAALFGLEDGKSPRSKFKNIWWNTSGAINGFTGYSTATGLQELLIHSELLAYNYYYQDMPYLERQKVKKHMEKLEKERYFETVSKVLPSGLNVMVREWPEIEEAIDENE